ncbi:hypothetical protein GVAV_003156 [Gurleya vavrai]
MFNIEKLNPFFDSLKIVDELINFIECTDKKYLQDLYRKLSGNEYSRPYLMTFFNDNNDAKFSYYKKSNDRMNELITKVNSEIRILKKSVIYDFISVKINDILMSYIIEYDPLLVLTTIPIDEDHFYKNDFFYFQANYKFLKYNYIFQNVFKLNNIKLYKNYMIVKLSFIALAGQLQMFESAKKNNNDLNININQIFN